MLRRRKDFFKYPIDNRAVPCYIDAMEKISVEASKQSLARVERREKTLREILAMQDLQPWAQSNEQQQLQSVVESETSCRAYCS
jgi:hypothetical protein